MDDDLDVAAGLASLASPGITTAPSLKGGAAAAGYDPEETQSQDGQGGPFTPSTYDQAGMQPTFMQDQFGLDLDGFPLNHVFPDDYGLEEEDEVDTDGEPLFEDKLSNQAVEAFQALGSFKVQRKGKSFNLSHCWRIIKDEQKFKLQYAALIAHGGKEAVEEVGEGEKPCPRGKTNSKKEDKRDVASIALIADVEGMVTKKDSREEKRRQDKEEQMSAFIEIQRRWLEMEAKKQARMLEMEAEKQAKMLEIEAANAKTKTKKWLSLA
ncbi:Phospholipid-transporting ATPase 1 [Hordeum vulgare]|nr:Phospholipid-transporting ATPase 1 [Hordeum vulgare]